MGRRIDELIVTDRLLYAHYRGSKLMATALTARWSGLSARNLKYMRAFASAWADRDIMQAPLAQLTWYHRLALIQKLDDKAVRLWYATRTRDARLVARNILAFQIVGRRHARQGKALNKLQANATAGRFRLRRTGIQRSLPVRLPRHSGFLRLTTGPRPETLVCHASCLMYRLGSDSCARHGRAAERNSG
jgi:hypothetical protein